ncbi:MAG TPA: Lsr2 family protein [Micromonosporaceae bacterium]|nr:Lsr2 family protein [Micromonosporaceae bacterium]
MVRKVEVKLVDDLDGGAAEESITFALDGTNYQIDLSRKNAAKLRSSLEPFVQAAHRIGRTPARSMSGRAGNGVPKGDREQNRAIREWAGRKGLEVSPRGRISRNIIQQYHAQAGR